MLVPNAETPLATAPEKIIKVRRVLGYRLGIKKNVFIFFEAGCFYDGNSV